MDRNQWVRQIRNDRSALRDIVERFHPANTQPHKSDEVMDASITAPNAERACEMVRQQIREKSFDRPEVQFDIALAKQDVATLHALLSESWFGMPESVECRNIAGFFALCDLVDELPNE